VEVIAERKAKEETTPKLAGTVRAPTTPILGSTSHGRMTYVQLLADIFRSLLLTLSTKEGKKHDSCNPVS
jgi:hypothetical protein